MASFEQNVQQDFANDELDERDPNQGNNEGPRPVSPPSPPKTQLEINLDNGFEDVQALARYHHDEASKMITHHHESLFAASAPAARRGRAPSVACSAAPAVPRVHSHPARTVACMWRIVSDERVLCRRQHASSVFGLNALLRPRRCSSP